MLVLLCWETQCYPRVVLYAVVIIITRCRARDNSWTIFFFIFIFYFPITKLFEKCAYCFIERVMVHISQYDGRIWKGRWKQSWKLKVWKCILKKIRNWVRVSTWSSLCIVDPVDWCRVLDVTFFKLLLTVECWNQCRYVIEWCRVQTMTRLMPINVTFIQLSHIQSLIVKVTIMQTYLKRMFYHCSKECIRFI